MSDNGLWHTQTHIPRGPSGSVSRIAFCTGGGTKRTSANHIKLHSECTHTALPRPPSGTVCGVDIGNRADLEDEGAVATGR